MKTMTDATREAARCAANPGATEAERFTSRMSAIQYAFAQVEAYGYLALVDGESGTTLTE